MTITDHDAPASWPGRPCNVAGTVGNLEVVNGTPMTEASNTNVAHTFAIPSLGLNVESPGQSTVTFTVWFNETGSFQWFCETPCGTNGCTGGPMSTPGYMSGALTVTGG